MAIRASAAVRDITPPVGSALFGYTQAKRLSTGVLDPLQASVVHIRTGAGTVTLVSLDVMFLAPQTVGEIRRAVQDATSTPEENVLVATSFTHSGPVTVRPACWSLDSNVPEPDADYLEQVKASVIDASSEAAATNHQVELAWLDISTCDLPGPVAVIKPAESRTGALVLKDKPGSPIAVVMVSDVPPRLLGESSTEISADYPGHVRRFLQEQYGATFALLHFAAPCQGIRACAQSSVVARDACQTVGRELGRRVAEGISGLGDDAFCDDVSVRCRQATVRLPVRALPGLWDAQVNWGDSKARYKKLAAADECATTIQEAHDAFLGAEGTVNLVKLRQGGRLDAMLNAYQSIRVQVVSLAGMYLVGLPGMLAVEYGVEITEASGDGTFAVCGVNGDLQGFIVSAASAESGDYGRISSPFGPEAGQALADAAVDLVRSY